MSASQSEIVRGGVGWGGGSVGIVAYGDQDWFVLTRVTLVPSLGYHILNGENSLCYKCKSIQVKVIFTAVK